MKKVKANYFELAKTSLMQRIIYFGLVLIGMIIIFNLSTSFLQYFVENNLQGQVFNKTGETKTYTLEDDKNVERLKQRPDSERRVRIINFYNSWAVDLYKGTASENRYWFQPIFATFALLCFSGILFATLITTLLPIKSGYFRQKIEREILNSLDNVHFSKFGTHIEEEDNEISEEICSADLRKLYLLSTEWKMPIDDLNFLRNAIIWRNSSLFSQILHPFRGLALYLRNHFTEKYSNSILSFVYVGAAFLIIIIGLRGLKFIPSSEPSLVFFALGLEFSILITYALTLLFSKPEEQQTPPESNLNEKIHFSDKQMEKLLRTFLKWKN